MHKLNRDRNKTKFIAVVVTHMQKAIIILKGLRRALWSETSKVNCVVVKWFIKIIGGKSCGTIYVFHLRIARINARTVCR